ncbi:hypothetical protein Sros_4775 [Streptosporangium roseum DSM 43021]|uniref:Uncharacterized protein n=1 Tax=Streptosporangium roseum (strain ATCC 12428 / DSM 43021 / JCM 3005 / KCTC 9067 / NCIMB 10171 / NRRL 2505 / NI 9100) TaxID=479432 RepID=D2B582_STRRD|nr:hypothetical protein Sros_4775 [Streptosporangium roseum DSM 43021]
MPSQRQIFGIDSERAGDYRWINSLIIARLN